MINLYVNEYLAISQYLQDSDKVMKKGKYAIVSKLVMIKLLDKNAYESSHNKLKNWRELHWIDAEPDRMTKRVMLNGVSKPMVKVDLKIADTLRKIAEQK